MEGLIGSSDPEGNDKIRNKNKEKILPDELASFTPIIVSAIDNIRNIKCKRPDIDAIYRNISETVAANVDRDFIEIIVVELVNKTIIFNKPTAQGIGSYFIVNAKELTNSTIANENLNLNLNSNISSDSHRSSSNAPDKIHADKIEKRHDPNFCFCK